MRTVQRWEKVEGLPIRRLQHRQRAAPFAFTGELDAWLAARTRSGDRPTLAGARPWPQSRVIAVGTAAALIAVAIASLAIVARSHPAGPVLPHAGDHAAVRIKWPVAPGPTGAPSRDGQLVPFIERETRSLSILDVGSGAIWRLFSPDEEGSPASPGNPTFSFDGSRLAYTWRDSNNCETLWTIDRATRSRHKLWEAAPGDSIASVAWSHRGSDIAATVSHNETSADLVLISSDGRARTLLERRARGAAFSPDDQSIAVVVHSPERRRTDIGLIDRRTGALATLAADDEADEANPIWIDRATLSFTSQNRNGMALWTVDLATRARRLVDRGLGEFRPLGTTDTGAMFYAQTRNTQSVMVSVFPPDSSLPPSAASPDDNGVVHSSPDWSPDGRRLAWIVQPPGPRRHLLYVRDLATGTIQTYEPPARGGGPVTGAVLGMNPRFSMDGSRVLIRATDRGRSELVICDLATGAFGHPLLAGRDFGDAEWDRDSRHVFVLEFSGRILRVDTATGEELTVYVSPTGTRLGRAIALSPDRKRMAFVLLRAGEATLTVMDRGGTRSWPVLTAPSDTLLLLEGWTRDGATILFVRGPRESNQFRGTNELWAVPAAGGSPRSLNFASPGMHDVRPSPDGRRIAYNYNDGLEELWVVDHAFSRHAR
jgi:Tol biopolymer transport system component